MNSQISIPLVLTVGIIVTINWASRGPLPTPSPQVTTQGPEIPASQSDSLPPPNPDRDVFLEQTHVHTSWSMDAYVIGNTMAGPEEAYRWAL